MKESRRDFIKKAAIGTAGVVLSARSYASILGANDRVNMAIVGVNGRGQSLIRSSLASGNTAIRYICDVDSRAMDKAVGMTKELAGKAAKGVKDFRELLEKKNLDAIAVATPEHWHAPMGIMGVNADKHVYLEKPAAHNPAEARRLVDAQKSTGKLIQIGTQQRSAPTSLQGIKDIKDGIIGRAYFAKTWYSNTRGSIGRGKSVEVPEWLDWDLWQGPAPRKDYKDNIVHYNWHWFRHWGTGEVHNNGTHEIDIARLALGVDLPNRVGSNGGRFQFEDDWEYYDTQVVNFEYDDNKLITWEGKSCNGLNFKDRGRGIMIHGTEGSILLDRNIYILYDLKGKEIKRTEEKDVSATTDTVGAGSLDTYHMKNFLSGIREGAKLNAPIDDASITNMMCHYGNISQTIGNSIEVDTSSGKILDDAEANKMWSREYESGWEF